MPSFVLGALLGVSLPSFAQPSKSDKPAKAEENYPAAPNINAPLDKHRSTQGYATSSGVSSEDRAELSREDRRFLTEAMEPMDERLKMAKLASTRARHPDVKAFAERRVQEQTDTARAVEQLAVKKKFGLVKADKEPNFEKLYDRKQEDFDAAFLHAERKALEDGAERYRKAAKETSDADVRETAQRLADVFAASAAEAIRLEAELRGKSE